MDSFMQAAIEEARLGLSEGGIPIGSVLVYENGSSATGTTVAFNRAARFCMARWMRWKTPVARRP